MDLNNFAHAWMNNPIFMLPDDNIDISQHLHGVTLFRDGPWQVQLFIADRDTESTIHNHPNCESIQVHFGGDQQFTIADCVVPDTKPFDSCHIPAGHDHAVTFGKRGGAYLSIQCWDKLPESIRTNWGDNSHQGLSKIMPVDGNFGRR